MPKSTYKCKFCSFETTVETFMETHLLDNHLKSFYEKEIPEVVFPKPLEKADLSILKTLCREYVETDPDELDDDLEHYIFEAAIETIYGKDVWKFINSK